ncbi:hypothetical protein BG004_007295, partial [Podila humilis]
MASASLSIPIAFWPNNVPFASISASLTCDHHVVLGLEDGLIWLLKVTVGNSTGTEQAPEFSLGQGTLLVGHNTRVTALASMLVQGDAKNSSEWVLVSASEDG